MDNTLTTFYKEQLAKRTKQIESDTGLTVSSKHYTIKQFLYVLNQNNKLPLNYITKGKIKALSSMARKLCIQNNYYYVKTKSLKYSHRNSISAYPIEILKQLYFQEIKINE